MGYPIRWEQLAIPQVSDQRIEEDPAKSVSLRRYLRRLIARTLVVTAFLVLLVIALFSLALNGGHEPALRLESMPAGTAASAVAPKSVRRLGFVSVTGNVVNHTATALDRVEVVVDLLDADGHTLHTQSAMVALDQIAPGQAAGFECELADDVKATAYRLHFRKLFGEDIN